MAVDFPSGVADTTPTFLVGGDSATSNPAKAAITTFGLSLIDASNAAAAQAIIGVSPDSAFAATASGTNTYTATLSPVPAGYVTNQKYTITFTNASTGAATLNLNGLGAEAIQLRQSAIASGTIPALSTLILEYDGTQFQIIGQPFTNTGTVTSVGGDGTVLASTPVTGSGTLALANAPAYTKLANNTSSSAPPTYVSDLLGSASLGTSTLTASSPSVIQLANSAGAVALTLPAASTCPNKVFSFTKFSGSFNGTIILNAADTFSNSGSAGVTITLEGGSSQTSTAPLTIISAGSLNTWLVITNTQGTLSSIGSIGSTGGILTNVNSSGTAGQIGQIAAVASGQVLTSQGTSSLAVWSASPTTTHQVAGGTLPTVAVGAAAGTGGSVGATITGHDTDLEVTIVTGASGQSSGVLATVTYGTAYATAPFVTCTASGANDATLIAAGSIPYMTRTTGTAVINLNAAPAANTTYLFTLHSGQ